jgi:hypothetical protein
MGGGRMSQVAVPWQAGMVCQGEPSPADASPSRRERCAAKAAQITEDIWMFGQAEYAAIDPQTRRHFTAQRAFQEQRLAWLMACVTADDDVLATRQRTLEGRLGPAGLMALAMGSGAGLMAEMVADMAHLALVRFVREAA